MRDRRYSTAGWQRLRRAVLARDGWVCQVQGPRCTGIADTVDHFFPSSAHPHLFWAEENLRVEELRQEIDRLRERLLRYETVDGRPPKPPEPAIY